MKMHLIKKVEDCKHFLLTNWFWLFELNIRILGYS